MKVSDKGADFIAKWEGEILEVYLDPVDLPTLGIGHLLTKSELAAMPVGTKISKELSRHYFAKDIAKFERAVSDAVKVPMNQNQFDALVSLAFNIGIGAFNRSSVVRQMNAQQPMLAANAFLAWNKATRNGKKIVLQGLTNRREAERKLFLSPTSAAPQTLSEDKQVPAVTPQDSANTPPSNASGQTLKAEITPDGGVKVESQEGAPQPQERIAVVQTQPQKWSNRVTTKITGVVTGNALFQWIWSQMEKLQGLEIHDSVWIIVSLTIAIGSLLWIVHEIVNTWRENKRQEKIDELLVKENSTVNNLVQLIPSDETDLYRARGFKIITRGEKA